MTPNQYAKDFASNALGKSYNLIKLIKISFSQMR